MKIHEYQGKEIMRRYGVAVPIGKAAMSVADAEEAAAWVRKQTGAQVVVVKAQIHAGGRGKGGGVKVARDEAAAKAAIAAIFGMQLKTHQTGPDGMKVRRLLIEQGLDIARELYVGIVLDRAVGRIAVMASTEGGMDIEQVAAKHPEKILRETVDPAIGFRGFQARNLAFALGLSGEAARNAAALLSSLYRMYVELDCSIVEVNPLVVTKSGQVLALDAKINFDDNATYRHPELAELVDLDEEDPSETEAKKFDLSYINLDGTIGCMVNGAGLAMSTMDIIKLAGASPANFLDVGGGATKEKVTAAFKIITRDQGVRGIFVNIFGGIMRCDTIAEGIIAAVKEVGLAVPLVVRLEGTNVELGKKMLAESGLNLVACSDMADGARRIVELSKGAA